MWLLAGAIGAKVEYGVKRIRIRWQSSVFIAATHFPTPEVTGADVTCYPHEGNAATAQGDKLPS